MSEALQLYSYQQAILHQLRQRVAQGHRSILLAAPTGAGKTEIAISLLQGATKKGNRAAMMLDRIVLCDQTSDRLDRYGVDHGVLQSGHWRYRPYEQLQVCSAQTLERRRSLEGLKLLIIDEAHEIRRHTTKFIRNNADVVVVGLSATPFTKGLGQIYTCVVSGITALELVKLGRLAPLRVFIAKEIDMSGAKKIAGEWAQQDLTQRGMRLTGDIVTEWVRKTHEVFGGARKTVVFSAGVAHGADLAQKFQAAGYNFHCLSYRSDETVKRDAIHEFAKTNSSIHGLIATDILTKGFDVSDVMIGVSARPFSKSLSSHIQQMGRVMRAHAGKDFALWLDHSGNYLRFQEDWDDVYENGVQDLDERREKTKKEKTAEQKEAAKCPKCAHLWPVGADFCPHCGHVRARRSDVTAVPGEMEELTGVGHAREEKKDFYAQLLGYAEEHGYQASWAGYKFKDKFGSWPNGLNVEAMPASMPVRNWLLSQRIREAKALQKKRVAT